MSYSQVTLLHRKNHKTLRQYTIMRTYDEEDYYKLIDEVHIMFHAAKKCPALFDLVRVVRSRDVQSRDVSPHNCDAMSGLAISASPTIHFRYLFFFFFVFVNENHNVPLHQILHRYCVRV